MGWILLVFAISGFTGTIREMSQRWPDDRGLLSEGCCFVIFSCGRAWGLSGITGCRSINPENKFFERGTGSSGDASSYKTSLDLTRSVSGLIDVLTSIALTIHDSQFP
jgi:hypothetical protein